ncbi:holo-ACP synthase [Limosilactobacillus caecicola]|uniref:holo-ACP synthase n=1 Tax=Limosilactobacillus caecicola TaxID=2941332 RepID=UPI00203A9CF1|nr:holo-ACP synthase [Limosilactobacillus caecicola]
MLAGLGIDLTEIDRIKKAASKQPQFIKHVLTQNEQEQLAQFAGQRYWEYLSGRWSLKESFSKAYGTGIGSQVSFQDIEILDNQVGRPIITKSPFQGVALASVSHTGTLVMTEVVLEKETTDDE